MRHDRRSKSIPFLRERIETMATILKERRENGDVNEATGRTLKGCVMVMVWTEEDGTETVSVVGDELNRLELKDAMHDWLYPFALDYEGFIPAPYLD